jgi:hypothetical protein
LTLHWRSLTAGANVRRRTKYQISFPTEPHQTDAQRYLRCDSAKCDLQTPRVAYLFSTRAVQHTARVAYLFSTRAVQHAARESPIAEQHIATNTKACAVSHSRQVSHCSSRSLLVRFKLSSLERLRNDTSHASLRRSVAAHHWSQRSVNMEGRSNFEFAPSPRIGQAYELRELRNSHSLITCKDGFRLDRAYESSVAQVAQRSHGSVILTRDATTPASISVVSAYHAQMRLFRRPRFVVNDWGSDSASICMASTYCANLLAILVRKRKEDDLARITSTAPQSSTRSQNSRKKQFTG